MLFGVYLVSKYRYLHVLLINLTGGNMNSETGARRTHGDLIYRKTWAGQYWGWNGVIVLAFLRLAWYVVTFRAGKGFVAAASSYYSAASDMKRKGDFSKTIDRLKFRFAGGFSLVFGFFCLSSRFFQLAWCAANELDVLGTICTKAKVFWLARAMFKEIERQYDVGRADDHTFAFAFKWKLEDPSLGLDEINTAKNMICVLMIRHPEWAPQIKARLYEALGEKELEKIERLKIVEQFK